MCCVDLQPFNIVERPGFQKYIKRLDPQITFPTARTVATSALNDVYNVYMVAIKQTLEKSPNEINLVLDMWTDRYKRISYINIKIHYCVNFQIRNITLKTEHFAHPHTGKQVAKKIDETLMYFNLINKNIKAVTDSGSNIISALNIKNIERFSCLAHTLHRFLMHDILHNESFKDISVIILKLKDIYRSVTFKTEEIQKMQELKQNEDVYINIQNIYNSLNLDENFITGEMEDHLAAAMKTANMPTIKNSVPTRWNSLLEMVKSFEKNLEVVNVTLVKLKMESLLIHPTERKVLSEFRGFLEIFEEATCFLQGQKYPTMSTWIYFYESLQSQIRENEGTITTGTAERLYDFAKRKFESRFSIQKIHVMSALMDPCQKNWPKLQKYLKKIPQITNLKDSHILKHDVVNPVSDVDLICNVIKSYNVNEIPPPSFQPKGSSERKQACLVLKFV